jgi:hypothetical protein
MDSSYDSVGINVPESDWQPKEEPTPIEDNHAVTAVDIAEATFEVAVSTQPGRVSERRTLSRSKFLVFFATRPATTVVMEACGSSHHWARQLQQLGHRAVLLGLLSSLVYET